MNNESGFGPWDDQNVKSSCCRMRIPEEKNNYKKTKKKNNSLNKLNIIVSEKMEFSFYNNLI